MVKKTFQNLICEPEPMGSQARIVDLKRALGVLTIEAGSLLSYQGIADGNQIEQSTEINQLN